MTHSQEEPRERMEGSASQNREQSIDHILEFVLNRQCEIFSSFRQNCHIVCHWNISFKKNDYDYLKNLFFFF